MKGTDETKGQERALLAGTARKLIDERSPITRVRKLRDTDDAVGFSWELWREIARLGWVGLHLPEAYGGAEMPFADLAVIIEAAGRRLMPEPLLSAIFATELVSSTGPGQDDVAATWLSRIAAGETILGVAYQEATSRYDACSVSARADETTDGFRLFGEKIQVLDGHVAEGFVVSARTRGDPAERDGISLFLVRADSPGMTITRQHRVDGRNAAIVRLDGVEVPRPSVVGELHRCADPLIGAIDRATIALSAEMLGAAAQAFEDTLSYLKSRKQFGVPIGSFQALQHRAAKLFVEISLARAAVNAAAQAVDRAPDTLPRMASLAKARCSDVFVHVTNEAVQMHGGIGMTDDHHIGFYMKRARAADVTFGDATWHRRRWADLAGY